VRDAIADPNYEYTSRRTVFDDALRLHLQHLLDRYAVNCVVDVGANYGTFGRLIGSTGYQGRIVSFEPVAATFASLTSSIEADDAWETHQFALGSREETARINVTAADNFSSFLQPNAYGHEQFGAETDVDHGEEVQVRRLDALWPVVTRRIESPRVFLKMDTQGWDLEVLVGASAILGDVVAVQSEIAVRDIYEDQQTGHADMIDHLAELGFDLSGLFPVNLDDQMRVIEFDCVAVRAGA
jgi:FkbM family methyltransferase